VVAEPDSDDWTDDCVGDQAQDVVKGGGLKGNPGERNTQEQNRLGIDGNRKSARKCRLGAAEIAEANERGGERESPASAFADQLHW
jgi:hypothetical protein